MRFFETCIIMQSNNNIEKNEVKIISTMKLLNHFCFGKSKHFIFKRFVYFKKNICLTVCSMMMEKILSDFIITFC